MQVTGSTESYTKVLQRVTEYTMYFPDLCGFTSQRETSMKPSYQLNSFKFWKQNLVPGYRDFSSRGSIFEQNTELQDGG